MLDCFHLLPLYSCLCCSWCHLAYSLGHTPTAGSACPRPPRQMELPRCPHCPSLCQHQPAPLGCTLALTVCDTGEPCRPVWCRVSRTSPSWSSIGLCQRLYCPQHFALMTSPTPTATAAIPLLLDAARKLFLTSSHGLCVLTGTLQPCAPSTWECCQR